VARTSIELASLIQTVADQLRAARDSAKKDDPIIDLAECELEMAVEVTNEGGAGIKVWVFELGGRRTKLNSNTVKVRFAPHGNVPVAFVASLPAGTPGPVLGRDVTR
jgi:Trypsin-co-occurring domain 2